MLKLEIYNQWYGFFDGMNNGIAILNLEFQNPLLGQLILIETVAEVKIAHIYDLHLKINHRIEGEFFHGKFFDYLSSNSINLEPLDYEPPKKGGFSAEYSPKDEKIIGKWWTDGQRVGSFVLTKKFPKPVQKICDIKWPDIHDLVNETNSSHALFRGQKNISWSLESTMHRARRYNIARYLLEDVSELVYHVNSISSFKYNIMEKSIDLFALLGLAQHHGFPTPLIDWTESAYIAIYFGLRHAKEGPGRIRLYKFYRDRWLKCFAPRQFNIASVSVPYLEVNRFAVYENARAIQQQSWAMYSNIKDIEGFIRIHDTTILDGPCLHQYDFVYEDRNQIMTELRAMGITSASMFPGMDGTCESLKEKLYFR